jgi:GT2 family glycosyltransferase
MVEKKVFSFPVGVQLFNRPEYAEKFLTSLRQQSLPVDQSRLFIFIDGFKGSIYESRGTVDKTWEVEYLAKELFPNATILRLEENCGIADLHNRLQTRVFANNNPWAAFFEEDLILDKRYLEELSDLIEIVDGSEEVVKVACFQIISRFSHLPRGYNGFYPGYGTQAFAERRSFFVSKQEIVLTFIDLVKKNLGSQSQFKDSYAAAIMATHGHILPYFQHDSLIESILLLERKLHVVTKPNLVEDIGGSGIHDYTTIQTSVDRSQLFTSDSLAIRKQRFQNELPIIRVDARGYMTTLFMEVFDSFHLSKSRRAMLKEIFRRTV